MIKNFCYNFLSYKKFNSLPSLHQTSSSDKNYLVKTSKCNIISSPLFDNETIMINKNMTNVKWNCERTNYLKDKSIEIQRINGSIIRIKWDKKSNNFIPNCAYREMIRVNDNKIKFGPSIQIHNEFTQIDSIEYIKVICYENDRKVFGKVIPLVPKVNKINLDQINTENTNILLLGIDSVSTLNFERHFIRTKKLIEQHNFHQLEGYTKIGDNTFPNLMGLLTGYHYTKFWNESFGSKMYFDNVPFIWKKFAEKNYTTVLIEDLPVYSLFNYKRKGFKVKPTDYYLRPVSLAIESSVKHQCYGQQLEIDVIDLIAK